MSRIEKIRWFFALWCLKPFFNITAVYPLDGSSVEVLFCASNDLMMAVSMEAYCKENNISLPT